MTEQKRRCLGNINLQLEDGLWHRYSKDEIDSVIEMSNALYRICPAPDKEFNIKRCPMNCPFRPYKNTESDHEQTYGCRIAQALIGDKWRLQRWADRQSENNDNYKTVERDD